MEKLWNWIIFASDRVDEKDQYCVRWFSNLYLIPSSQLSLMASHQQVTAISSLKYHFPMLWNWTNMQICTLEFPSVSFGRANALEHCKQCKHSNDVAAHFQMLPTLKREEKKTPSILRIRGKPLHKVFFRRKRVWRDLRLLRQITLSWAPLTTASLRHSDLQNFAMLTGVYGRRWRMLLWNCVFAKEHLERMTFRKPLSEYYLKRSG